MSPWTAHHDPGGGVTAARTVFLTAGAVPKPRLWTQASLCLEPHPRGDWGQEAELREPVSSPENGAAVPRLK